MKKAVIILYIVLAIQILMIPVAMFFGHAAIAGIMNAVVELCDKRYVLKPQQ